MGNTKDNHKDGNSSSNSSSKTVMNLTNNHINDHSVRFYGAKVSDCEMKQQNILQYVKSQNWFYKSLRLREQHQADTLLAISYRRIGVLYGTQKNDTLAAYYFEKQLKKSHTGI